MRSNKKNSKEDITKTWAFKGIYDFFIAFDIENKHTKYSTFFCHQGLEKICKCYLLGKRSHEYECLSEKGGLDKVQKIVKKMGHNLKKLLDKEN